MSQFEYVDDIFYEKKMTHKYSFFHKFNYCLKWQKERRGGYGIIASVAKRKCSEDKRKEKDRRMQRKRKDIVVVVSSVLYRFWTTVIFQLCVILRRFVVEKLRRAARRSSGHLTRRLLKVAPEYCWLPRSENCSHLRAIKRVSRWPIKVAFISLIPAFEVYGSTEVLIRTIRK